MNIVNILTSSNSKFFFYLFLFQLLPRVATIYSRKTRDITIYRYILSAANKCYSSADHDKQKNKKTTGQVKFLVVTIKQ